MLFNHVAVTLRNALIVCLDGHDAIQKVISMLMDLPMMVKCHVIVMTTANLPDVTMLSLRRRLTCLM